MLNVVLCEKEENWKRRWVYCCDHFCDSGHNQEMTTLTVIAIFSYVVVETFTVYQAWYDVYIHNSYNGRFQQQLLHLTHTKFSSSKLNYHTLRKHTPLDRTEWNFGINNRENMNALSPALRVFGCWESIGHISLNLLEKEKEDRE